MMKIAAHFHHVSVLFKKILDKMHVKIRFVPDNIWNEEAVVKLRAKNTIHLLTKCIIAAGKNMKMLNLGLSFTGSSCFSSLTLLLSYKTF